jgi:hypothetical protein
MGINHPSVEFDKQFGVSTGNKLHLHKLTVVINWSPMI